MTIDRRELLIGAASSAASLSLPWHRAKAARGEELFAAARRDDRGTYSAALFSLDGGDVRAVELPERGHDIALRPGSGEWVAFARRPGRFGVAVPTDGRQPIWFNSKPDRHFFGHGVAKRLADGLVLERRAIGDLGLRRRQREREVAGAHQALERTIGHHERRQPHDEESTVQCRSSQRRTASRSAGHGEHTPTRRPPTGCGRSRTLACSASRGGPAPPGRVICLPP